MPRRNPGRSLIPLALVQVQPAQAHDRTIGGAINRFNYLLNQLNFLILQYKFTNQLAQQNPCTSLSFPSQDLYSSERLSSTIEPLVGLCLRHVMSQERHVTSQEQIYPTSTIVPQNFNCKTRQKFPRNLKLQFLILFFATFYQS